MKIEVIPSGTLDAYWPQIRQIRYDVFVIEQNVDEQEEYDEFEGTAKHVVALADGLPVGTARWRPTSNGFKLERFAVLKNFRSSGVGSAVLQSVLADVLRATESDPKLIYLHAQMQAIPFYERHGFVAFGEEFTEAEIQHRVMKFER